MIKSVFEQFEEDGFLHKDLFFYFIDSVFRAISKVFIPVSSNNQISEVGKSWRLSYIDIEEFC